MSRWANVPAFSPVEPPTTACAAQLFDGAPADVPSRIAIHARQSEAADAAREVSTSAGDAAQETGLRISGVNGVGSFVYLGIKKGFLGIC